MHAHVDDEAGTVSAGVARASKWAKITFVVLFLMNLLDYTDRWVLASVLTDVQAEFKLNNTMGGFLATVFLVSYSLISPVMGWLGDRTKRTWLLCLGVGVWSLATVGSGLARDYNQMILARAFLGIGEATYGVLAPTLLMDLFPREKRARVMSGFYLAMPLGGALGMTLGAVIAHHWGWRWSFFVVGAPGLLAAFAAFILPEPVRGSSEGVDAARLKEHETAGASKADYIDLMVNSSYTYSVFGMAMYTFAIGGLALWLPKFLEFTRHFNKVNSHTTLGGVTALAAIIGMTAGGWLADRLGKKSPRALFIVPGVAMLGSIPFILIGLLSTNVYVIFVAIFFAELLMFINTGPCNAVIANVVAPNMRAAAYAVAIFAVHFLGDIWSSALIGYFADLFGKPDTMLSVIGTFLTSIGAIPVLADDGTQPQNMVAGLLIVVPAVLLSGIVLLAGARHLPREMALMLAKLKAAPAHSHSGGKEVS